MLATWVHFCGCMFVLYRNCASNYPHYDLSDSACRVQPSLMASLADAPSRQSAELLCPRLRVGASDTTVATSRASLSLGWLSPREWRSELSSSRAQLFYRAQLCSARLEPYKDLLSSARLENWPKSSLKNVFGTGFERKKIHSSIVYFPIAQWSLNQLRYLI